MKGKDTEVISTASSTSKGSEKRKSSARFSLRRIFYSRRSRSKSQASLDLDTRSESSITNTNVIEKDSTTVRSASSSDSLQPAPKRGDGERECPLCLSEHTAESFPDITTCYHRSCISCLRQYLKIEITESRVNICCPECAERFHPNDIKMILQDDILIQKYEDFMVRRVLVSNPDARWCPAPNCSYAVIATGCASCPRLRCERPGCDTSFCYHCKQHWHPNQTCDAARAERSPNIQAANLNYNQETGSQKDDIKPCPRCSAFITKMNDGSCNHMTCTVCGAEFCWLCMKEISDLHYLSPSGCTFWGKKPWSRKKKILWQLGTLVGAPIGITLVAGIAVPALIIGIPVWVGRKLHSKYEFSSKHKRNLAVTSGVSASILFSPIIAGLAVGIGVPILLAYVYGVVPISLCRSGGCGVSTSNTGVRFEFDDNEGVAGSSGPYTSDNHSVETAHNVANPSIAPSIGEASVAMTNSLSASGSHMDRIGILRDESDRDSSSNQAIAGSSLNGSLIEASSFQNKLEVQADVSANPPLHKRASLSSESANFSIGEKSTTVSFGDDASTKALAGSIAGYKDKDSLSATSPSLEVQVDIVSGRCRNNSGSSVNTEKCIQAASPVQGSPVSGRSSSFSGDVKISHSKHRKNMRFSLSIEEKIHEQMDSCGADAAYRECIEGSTPHDQAMCLPYADSLCKNSSCESIAASASNSSRKCLPGLTEVENDKPSCSFFSQKTKSTTGNTRGIPSDGFLDTHTSLDCCLAEQDDTFSLPQGLRRRSCELALEHGRLSPTILI